MEYRIGYKLYKTDRTIENYAEMANWCNSNNAYIEDKGYYYEIIEKTPYQPTIEEQIAELEMQIEQLNTKMLRDIIILQNPNATEQEKEQAQTYFNEKIEQKQALVEQINELKNIEE